MKHFGLAVALACMMTGSAWVYADQANTYVPRSERESNSVMTFKGSSKGLVIIDHESGEVTRYTTKRQKALHRMTPEAEASARSAWESRQEAAAEYESELEDEENGSDDSSAESEESASAADSSDGNANNDSDDE